MNTKISSFTKVRYVDARFQLISVKHVIFRLFYSLGAVELLLKAAHSMEHVTDKRKSILDNVIETLRDAGVFNEGVHRKLSDIQLFLY